MRGLHHQELLLLSRWVQGGANKDHFWIAIIYVGVQFGGLIDELVGVLVGRLIGCMID